MAKSRKASATKVIPRKIDEAAAKETKAKPAPYPFPTAASIASAAHEQGMKAIADTTCAKHMSSVPDEEPAATLAKKIQFKDLPLMSVFLSVSDRWGVNEHAVKVGNSTAITGIKLTNHNDIVNSALLPEVAGLKKVRFKQKQLVTLVTQCPLLLNTNNKALVTYNAKQRELVAAE